MQCPACGTTARSDARYCGTCGAPLAPTDAGPGAARVAVGASGAGAATVAPEAAPRTSITEALLPFFRTVHRDRSGLLGAAVVFVLGALISMLGWGLLGLPAQLIRAFMPRVDCAPLQPGSQAMFVCSAQIGLLTTAGPLLVVLVFYLLRGPLRRLLSHLSARLPEEMRFLLSPLAATIVFTTCWAGIHYATGALSGLLPQAAFPAVVGLYTYATARWGDAIARRLGTGYFDWRDRYPAWTRVAAAAVVPMLFSLLLTAQQRVADTALKSQFIVLVALVVGYLAMTPRSGNLLAGIKDVVRQIDRRAEARA